MNNQDKANLIKRITEIEGLTDAERSSLLGLLRESKTYGLVWEDKPEAIEEKLRDELPILTEVPDKAIISEDKDAPNHIIIEGDNLEALSTLAYTHAGKIDVIYIDPPYNTGNKDFIYNDSYVDKEDAYRHSKWLSFMSKRLKIAKQLLSDRGVIFMSIGDDECCNLKLLSDSVFLANNFIEMYLWESTFRPDNSSPILRRNAEFVLCYAKNKNNISKFKGVVSKSEGMPSLTKGKEKIKTIMFPENSVKTLLPDGIYKKGIKDNGNELSWELMEDVEIKNGLFITNVVLRGHSYWSTQKKILNEISEGTEIWIKSESFVPYYKKNKLAENRPTKILDPLIVNDYIYANTEVKGLIEKGAFNNPKPTSLIKFLSDFTDNKFAIILDFFAGSGTTLHATMQLNAEDGGSRQCILVTNNENNICEEVTYERNKRVINGYTTPKGEEIAGLKKNNLRYYRTGFVGRSRSIHNMRKLVNLATDMLCIKEDLYTEQAMFGEINTHKGIFRYFEEGDKKMLVIYREEAIDELVEAIYNIETENKIKIYIFSPSEDPWEGSFEDVDDKVELCALPYAIYNTYRRILPKKHDTVISPNDDVLFQKEEDVVNN